MNKQTKEDIVEILLAIYGVPGQYIIGAMILMAFWNAMKDMTNWAIFFPIIAFIFIILENVVYLLEHHYVILLLMILKLKE